MLKFDPLEEETVTGVAETDTKFELGIPKDVWSLENKAWTTKIISFPKPVGIAIPRRMVKPAEKVL